MPTGERPVGIFCLYNLRKLAYNEENFMRGCEKMKQVRDRNPAMDVVRCFALLCVNALHFFGYTDLYWKPTQGMEMCVALIFRSFFMVCVPLFVMLSGYLMCHKELSRKYYQGIFRTLGTYVLASLFVIGAYHVFNILFYRERVSITEQLLGIFSFTTIPYAWYVEMYIGLFLLIPFLNILYRNLPSQKSKQVLILIMLFLTSAPSLLNVHNFRDLSWWLRPSSSNQYHPLIPAFWVDMYPITYYFIGCYLREYPLRMKKRTNLLLTAAIAVAAGCYTFYRCYGENFIWGIWKEMESPFFGAIGALVFSLLGQGKYASMGMGLRKVLARVSGWCFGAYLVSWIVEQYVYMIPLQFDVQVRYWQGPLLVPVVYVVSLAISAGLNGIYGALASLAGKRGRAV